MRISLTILCLIMILTGFSQKPATQPGILIGTVLYGDNSKSIMGATVQLIKDGGDSTVVRSALTAKDGSFMLDGLSFGYYRLRLSMTGYSGLTMDSINIRKERFDFDLNDIKLHRHAALMNEVVLYAEKPLIENKDGKISFNVGESALSAGSSATELLKQAPLVNVDNDGKVQLRGKDAKILIDDKPVELNGKQLQDLLESMPGSMIEKIEIMTTPPPQYANERGGVINIVTKKGKVGFTARINISYGSRGEAGVNGNVSYRKNKWNIGFSSGFGYNRYAGNSYSNRQNIYTDSISYFNAISNSHSNNNRPNFRLSIDYEINKNNSFNFTSQYNANHSGSASYNEYSNLNNDQLLYKLSNRAISNHTGSWNPNLSMMYSWKGKRVGEQLKFTGGFNYNANDVERDYFQQYLNPDHSLTGLDSTQQQFTTVRNRSMSLRLNYDRPLVEKKLFLNMGGNLSRFIGHNILNTEFLKKPEQIFVANEILSNDFNYHQHIDALRTSLRYDFVPDFYINAGVQAEHTVTFFDIRNDVQDYRNDYWSALPFATLVKKWKSDWSITVSYKRSIQRPGLGELNPSVDYSDPYNIRFGNPYLQPYYAENFDGIFGKSVKGYYFNMSMGYNNLQHIYSSIRTLLPDGKTNTTWENSSGRHEYETSVWGGLSVGKKIKLNLSMGYTYHVYSLHDKLVRYFRDGGSFYSTFNGSYQFSDVMNSSVNLTYNRFANPQGTLNNTLSMNMGIQRKFFSKKFIVAFNMIDPFRQQQNRTYTFGGNFSVDSYSFTHTRNFRLSLSYIFTKNQHKNRDAILKKLEKNKVK